MDRLLKLHARASSWQGRKRYLAAFACGVMMTLAMPPIFALPMLFPALAGFYWLVTASRSTRQAVWAGWWFGFGFFTTGTYWIAISMTVDLAKFGWMIPFSIFGLSGYLALFFALLGGLLYRQPLRGISGIIAYGALWFATEWLRGHLLTGFPWNVLSLAWTAWPASMQGLAWWGAYGLGFFTVLVFAMPAATPEDRRAGSASIAMLLAAAIAIGGGAWRISYGNHENISGVRLRIVQAVIPQELKWDPLRQIESVRKYIALTHGEGYERVTHVVWPETAVPFALEENSELLRALSQHAPPGGALMTGGLHAMGHGESWKIWNSFYSITREGIAGRYGKVKLVPFGEFVPLRRYLPVEKITPGATDFSEGDGAAALSIRGAPPVQPLICYEGIFPDFISRDPPGWMVNVTNDAWFGNSSGPYQHLHLVQMRSAEQGVPLVRAANTGISAVIDGYGRILARLPLNQVGVLDSALPSPLAATLYRRHGIYPFLLLLYGAVLFAVFIRK